LKYQRQCIEKGEQNLAEGAKEAANAVTNPLICGLNVRAGPFMAGDRHPRGDRAGEKRPCDFAPLVEPDSRASPIGRHASRSIRIG
jgi:hypothetical protein